jgi:hypothetical protein
VSNDRRTTAVPQPITCHLSVTRAIPDDTPVERLTAEEREAAWLVAFHFSLDAHSDLEIEWESDRWKEFGAHGIAELCEALLTERRADDFSIPAEVSRSDLDLLWARVPRAPVMSLVRAGAQCLVAALRLVFWLGATAEELAA